MTLLQAIILGIVQGITEFLPISSSGHLILTESIFKLEVESLRAFDVTVHVATLFAILIYFRNDFIQIIKDALKGEFKMLSLLIIGTVPAVIVGFLWKDVFDGLRAVPVVFAAMILAAGFFVTSERFPKRAKENSEVSYGAALLIGCFQALALLPGMSRSGSTISAGLYSGIKRHVAARFSFLLGSIAIFGAGLLTALDLKDGAVENPGNTILIAGFVSALIAGYASVAFLMKFLKHHSLHVFAVYLILLVFGSLSYSAYMY